MSNVEDDNNQGEINNNHRNYNADDDDKSEFHTKGNSDNSGGRSKTSCNKVFNKLNKKIIWNNMLQRK